MAQALQFIEGASNGTHNIMAERIRHAELCYYVLVSLASCGHGSYTGEMLHTWVALNNPLAA